MTMANICAIWAVQTNTRRRPQARLVGRIRSLSAPHTGCISWATAPISAAVPSRRPFFWSEAWRLTRWCKAMPASLVHSFLYFYIGGILRICKCRALGEKRIRQNGTSVYADGISVQISDPRVRRDRPIGRSGMIWRGSVRSRYRPRVTTTRDTLLNHVG